MNKWKHAIIFLHLGSLVLGLKVFALEDGYCKGVGDAQ